MEKHSKPKMKSTKTKKGAFSFLDLKGWAERFSLLRISRAAKCYNIQDKNDKAPDHTFFNFLIRFRRIRVLYREVRYFLY